MYSKFVIAFVLVVLAAITLAACAPATPLPEPTKPPAPTQAPAPKPTEAPKATEAPKPTTAAQAPCPLGGPLVIGMIQPITGAAATVAKRAVSGATLAVEEINAKGGILGCQVKLQVEDSQADAAVAVNAARKLIYQDKVQVIIGAYHSAATLAIMPLLPEAKVPMLESTATSPLITDQNNGWMFRISSHNRVDAETAVKRCWAPLKMNKVAFLYVNNDWGKSVPAGFEGTIKSLGGEIVLSEPLEQGGTNFLPQLTKLRSTTADTVFVTIDIEQTAILAKQAFEAGMRDRYKWIGTSGQNPEQFYALLKDKPEVGDGWMFISYYRPTYVEGGDFKLNVDFAANFSKRFPDLQAEYAAANGYNAVYIVRQALERAGKYDGTAIRDAMKKTDYDGLTGKLTFDEKGQAYPYVYYQQLMGGKYTVPCK